MDTSANQAMYEIQLQGHLNSRSVARFEGMAITLLPDGVTALTGMVTDQAALYGLLSRIRDLGAPLISVRRIPLDRPDES